jgi:hypothetical protein
MAVDSQRSYDEIRIGLFSPGRAGMSETNYFCRSATGDKRRTTAAPETKGFPSGGKEHPSRDRSS